MQQSVHRADPEHDHSPLNNEANAGSLANDTGRRTRHQRRDRWQWWGLWIQLLVLLVVSGYVAVSYNQWRQMIQQSNSLERVFQEAKETNRINREANARNQRLAEDALQTTRESNEAGQRAWIVYKGVEPTRVNLSQQPTRLIIWLGNVGNSPAVRVMTTSTLLISKGFPLPPPYNPTVPNVPNPNPEVRSETVVGPKGDYGTYVVLQNISPQSVDAINAGRVNRYVYGRLEYIDKFNRPRHTTWCVVYVPKPPQDTSSFAGCDAYNAID